MWETRDQTQPGKEVDANSVEIQIYLVITRISISFELLTVTVTESELLAVRVMMIYCTRVPLVFFVKGSYRHTKRCNSTKWYMNVTEQ